MKTFLRLTIVLTFAILAAGCPKKPTIVKEEATAPAIDTKAQEEKARKEAEENARAKAEAEERARKESEEKARREAERAFTAADIHFDFDRADIREEDREILKNLSDWLMKNKNVKIQIEGHCDERGNNDYNLALGERRAYSAKQYLAALGVDKARINIASYGEEVPLCNQSGEDCWWKNRRAHFSIQK